MPLAVTENGGGGCGGGCDSGGGVGVRQVFVKKSFFAVFDKHIFQYSKKETKLFQFSVSTKQV